MLETILRLMTTGGVFVGVAAVYAALRNHTRQLNAQIFLSYSDRLQTVRHILRTELLPIWTAELSEAELAGVLPSLLQVMHIIRELYELKAQGYVAARTWAIWSRDVDRFLTTPIVRGLHSEIRHEFHGHDDFIAWIERRRELASADPRARQWAALAASRWGPGRRDRSRR